MKNYDTSIEYLNNLSNILVKEFSPVNTINSVNKLFKSYLNIDKSQFVVLDKNNNILRDFVRNCKIIDDENSVYYSDSLYKNIFAENGLYFYFNNQKFHCKLDSDELKKINEITKSVNSMVFPLISNDEVFGFLSIETEKNQFDKEFFSLLNISSKLISGGIINYTLNEQMEISLNFYKAMKDIAKIIESQYELSYIIPLIGEMIDRFMSSHLIYIFVYKDGKYMLVWPNACKDENVQKLLDKINIRTDYIISEDNKIGVFSIINDENIQGAIVAYSNIEKLLQSDIDYLLQLTRQSGLTIQRANAYAQVLKYATLDALTGLNNRRQFEIRIKQEVSYSRRNQTPLCCMMIDIDYFKKVNDTYGHSAGDCVLKNVAQVIRNEIREYDIACRYGGEEFFIILPQIKLQEATLVAQRLRKVIETTKMDIREAKINGLKYINVTSSIGVCEYDISMDASSFAQKADMALYEAKKSGRNRVIVY